MLELGSLLADYAAQHPDEHETAAQFVAFLHSDAAVFERSHAVGHFTASCWLVSVDGQRVLLTHHRKLNRWLQLGGHCDGDRDVARAALREAEEESGLGQLQAEPDLFDIDRHRIPARGDEDEHWHYDLRFVIRAGGNEAFVVSDESHALAWVPVTDLLSDPDAEVSMRRMARKWIKNQGLVRK